MALTALLAACAPAPTDAPARDTDVSVVTPDDTDPDVCADHTWDTVGAPFVLTWCTPCHSADVKGELRRGAPASINFDTEQDAVALAAEMGFVAARPNPTMPPAGGPDEATRARFATWVACVTGLP